MTGIDVFRELLDQRTGGRFYGVVAGVVTNNQDPDGLGRVKVKFPWLTDQDESWWARIAVPMAGPGCGFYCLPEVDDEVLVAFEHGMAEYPYVLGCLWNGKSKPPESNSDHQNSRRVFQSRSGSIIRFDDTKGSEKVEIIGANGGASIVLDLSDNSITIQATGDLKLEGRQVTIKGTRVDIN